jgi:regulator of nucleoside diphosphate kinase
MDESDITLTELDVQRLTPILKVYEAGHGAAVVSHLRAKFKRAPVIPAEKVPPDLVTMNCRVVFRDERTGKQAEIVIAYPDKEDLSRGRVSILEPTSACLLGTRIGQTVECPAPDGKGMRLTVVEIKYQPEKAGHLHL